MKEKIAAFFKKLNNSYVIAAICVILVGVILLGAVIGLVAKPFSLNTVYTAQVDTTYVTNYKLTLLDGGRYELTQIGDKVKGTITIYGDYGYGRIKDGNALKNVIWFDNGMLSPVEVKSPFKLDYNGIEFTNGGGIFLLVCYCILICFAAAIATILLLKRKEGDIVFTNKMRLIMRLKQIEEMLGIKFEDEKKNAKNNEQQENSNNQVENIEQVENNIEQ